MQKHHFLSLLLRGKNFQPKDKVYSYYYQVFIGGTEKNNSSDLSADTQK